MQVVAPTDPTQGSMRDARAARWSGLAPLFLALFALVALEAAVELLLCWAVVRSPEQVIYGEGVVYEEAARLLNGSAVYASPESAPFAVTPYAPLYLLVTAALQALAGPGFAPGRVLTQAASLVSAGLVGYLGRLRTRERIFGLGAAVMFLAFGAQASPWFAFYRIDLLAVALSLGAVACLAGGTSWKRVVIGGILASLAVLTKQSFVAAGLACTVWLAWSDRRKGAAFALAWLVPILCAAAVLEATSHAFLSSIFGTGVLPVPAPVALAKAITWLTLQGALLALAVVGIWDRRAVRQPAHSLLALYWLAALLQLGGFARWGTSSNFWIESAAASCPVAAAALHRVWRGPSHQAPGWLGPLAAGFLALSVVATGQSSLRAARDLLTLGLDPGDAAGFQALVDRARGEPGAVMAEPLDAPLFAGRRPLLPDPFIMSVLYERGVWDPSPLVAEIRAGRVGLVMLGYPIDDADRVAEGFPSWPRPIVQAIRETMTLEGRVAGRYLYVPTSPTRQVS